MSCAVLDPTLTKQWAPSEYVRRLGADPPYGPDDRGSVHVWPTSVSLGVPLPSFCI